MSRTIHVAIQASSTSWMGGRDICMNPIDGMPVIYWTIKRILENFPDVSLRIVAPIKQGRINIPGSPLGHKYNGFLQKVV